MLDELTRRFAVRRGRIPIPCEICGAYFLVYPSHSTRRHCGAACRAEAAEAARVVSLWARIDLNAPGPPGNPGLGRCWLWRGHTVKGGYGQVWYRRRMILIHRWVYEALAGPIPVGRQLHHLCERPNCVRPEHLLVVTARQHVHLTPQGITGSQVGKTHCKRGHEFTPENTILDAKGGRKCRICFRAVNLASWHRRQARRREAAGG